MNDMLAITADPDSDDVLVSELAGSKADRVTVLSPDAGPSVDSDAAFRLVELVRRVELVSGAAVTGLAGDPDGRRLRPLRRCGARRRSVRSPRC